ncbi:hypothetical protein VPNG_01960 [Cytospora leucostoma]|uniref:MACPF-like domain-containing protein n=1 Tax=Cytospora leucostoma TaxID=1230097 RepID=A0A423XIR6_9PEZI|nr:hypothetical protein VPNG_01960 [Cytospora leucostoma]
MSLVKGLQGLTAGALDGVGDTLEVAGGTLNMAADNIEGGDASVPANKTEGGDASAPANRTGGGDSSAPANKTEGGDASAPANKTGGAGAAAPAGAPPPKAAIEDSIRVNLVNHRDPHHGGFYMKLSRGVRDKDNLSALRKMIAGSTERKDVALLDFCSKSGIIVPDTYSIRDYIDECLKSDGSGSNDGILDMYLRTALKKAGSDSKQRTEITEGQYMDPLKLSQLRTDFDDRAFKLLTGTFYKYPAQLEEEDWSVVAENNALCYGYCVARRKKDENTLVVGLERARYPAFRLKKRHILSDRLASKTVKDVTFYLRIPDFIIDDQSFVSTYETTSHLQSALATSAFTSTDVSAAASGTLFGCTMSASASYGQSASESKGASQESSKKSVTIAYNFPRVTVLMDKTSVELTMKCQKDLAGIKDSESLTKFLEDYGEFFSARVQLGGRLFATEEVEETSTTSNKTEETTKAMKAAASVSFGSFSASVSASHNDNATAASANAASNTASTLTWQARGGDTLLCNDPSAWCPTVGDFYYWRTTKQERVSHIVDFIGTLPEFEKVPKNLAQWRKEARKVAPSRAISLKQVKKTTPDSYLAGFDPVDVSIKRAMNACNSTSSGGNSGVSAKLYAIGAACLADQTDDPLQLPQKWEVESEDGVNVEQASNMISPALHDPPRSPSFMASSLTLEIMIKGYVDFDDGSDNFLYMTNVKSQRFFTFHVYSDERYDDYTSRPIPQVAAGAKIALRFVDKRYGMEGDVSWAGHDAGHQYLKAIYRERDEEIRCAQEFWLKSVDS